MLDEFIKRDDVSKLLEDICNSARYFEKRTTNSMGYQMYSGVQQILFLFYDALFKYKIIIDDMSYFDDFFEQVDKLIKKIDNFYDIGNGINRIIGRICACKLGIKDIEEEESKKEVLRYINEVYIVNGYYIHGYASHYYNGILENGFVIEEYNNLYDKFVRVQNILKDKKHLNILDKDFNIKQVELTNSFLLGCYYSANSPMFFSKLLCRNEFVDKPLEIDAYSNCDYELCFRNLNKVMNKLGLSDSSKSVFYDAFKSEWKLLDKSNSNISLMLVPNRLIDDDFDIELFIEEHKDISCTDSICKLLGQKKNVTLTDDIKKEDIVLVNLYGYKKYIKEEKKETLKGELEKTFIKGDDEFAFSNTYGKVSILVLLGTMLITIGVILTIIMFS